MPFTITCPACGKTVDSTERCEAGEFVRCAECGHEFTISKQNQKRSETPRKPRKIRTFLAAVVVLLTILGLSAAIYSTYLRNGPTAENRVQPQRELPMDVFIFRPSQQASIEFHNLSLMREKGWEDRFLPVIGAELPPERTLHYVQMESYCVMGRGSEGQFPTVAVISLIDPIDISTVAAGSKMEAMPGNQTPIFALSKSDGSWIAFQPGPRRIVFVSSTSQIKINREAMARFADRTAKNSPLPREMMEGIEHVSGYARIDANEYSNVGIAFSFFGSYTERSGVREVYSMRICTSSQVARAGLEAAAPSAKFEPEDKAASDQSELFRWVHGTKVFWFERRKVDMGR